MFGLGDEFEYFQCSECECLQIVSIPDNITDYYPTGYYSYQDKAVEGSLKKTLISYRDRYAISNRGIIGKLLYRRWPNEKLRNLRVNSLDQSSRILDVGCGAGHLLRNIHDLGYRNILGVDPFNQEDIDYPGGLMILKRDIYQVDGMWDLIMLHHSFEHMPDPDDIICKISRMLTDTGSCVIRMPIVSSYAWKHYGVEWVQLDAPRHFFIHSIKSMRHLAEMAGLDLYRVLHDSTSFQFWGSEQYKQGISLMAENSYAKSPEGSIFSDSDISGFQSHARVLNQKNEGDQAIFYLRKV